MEIQEDNLFPIKVFTIKTNIDTQPLHSVVRELKNSMHFHYGKDAGGWQGGENLFNLTEFSEFKTTLTNSITQIFNKEFTILDMWGSIYNKGDYNKIHNHPALNPMYYDSTIWSGVFYIKTNTDGSYLTIHNHHNVTDTYDYDPNDGDIILFNSHTYHSVSPHNSNTDRICIAFNFKLI